jgi:hypothetical protein
MKYYDRATMLIKYGYPTPTNDPYELAGLLVLKSYECINKNESRDAPTSTLSRHSDS